MSRRRLPDGERWQIIGMIDVGISYKAVSRQLSYHYSVISTLAKE